ncbi:SDR family NAD(P)-dependent oxidoreductase [Candidatus Pacearchaeota archaeon]|nr:SDR family NAD(P)-dependent oxidoreductase [Candidatus Pacearchaeota archaeon]
MNLKDSNIVITGAASGIGRAVALLLAYDDTNLIIIDKSKKELKDLKKEIDSIGRNCFAVECDISDEKQVKKSIQEIIKKYRKIDALINDAGILEKGKSYKIDPKKWKRVIDVNLFGTFLCCRYALPHMIKRKDGYIVNISSVYGKRGSSDSSAYCSSKFGIRGLSQSIFDEVRKYNVKVSIVCPDTTKTHLFDKKDYHPNFNKSLKTEDIAVAIRNVLTVNANAVIGEIDVVALHRPY